MYDLNLIPIHINQGQPVQDLIGFQAAGPPRRAARSRSDDRLVVFFTTKGGDTISEEIQQDWLQRLSHTFYKTSGSVTSAMRSLIETINLTIMEKNLKFAQDRVAMTGAINLVAVHRRHLYFAQSGQTHAFTLTHQGLQHFYDASQLDRGLGLSRSPAIRYFQTDLGTGGYLFMTDTVPNTWTEELLFSDGFPSLDQLRRRLLNQVPPDFRLGLVQIVPGEGQINRIQTTPHPVESLEGASPEPQTADKSLEPEINVNATDELGDKIMGDTQKVINQSLQEGQYEVQEAEVPEHVVEPKSKPDHPAAINQSVKPKHTQDSVSGSRTPMGARVVPEPSSRASKDSSKAGETSHEGFSQQLARVRGYALDGLANFFAWWRSAHEKVSGFLKHLVARWSPEGADGLPKLSRGTLLMIAVAVPLAVVAIAVGVYLARGRTLQYQYYFDQAAMASQTAFVADDPSIERVQWNQTLTYLDHAESYRTTDEIKTLRNEAQIALDLLDGAIRLSYHSAIIGSLHPEINITRIVSYGPDLYLLDETGGRVIHATRESQGYEVNDSFVCMAGNFGGGRIDALVDMVSLPINNPYQAHLLVVDSNGIVAYCAPGQDPVVQSLPSAEGRTGEITRITFENNHLFALNPSADTVRVYKSTNGQFLDAPFEFFERENVDEKPDMSLIVDLAVNGSELYLLRTDGRVVDCVSTGLPGNPLICENPVAYEDGRTGKEGQVVAMPESSYVSLLYTPPPDPSISILDATNADIYRFSLRFRLHQRLRSDMGDYEIDSRLATGFTIGIDRIAFIAFGHQVFYGYVE